MDLEDKYLIYDLAMINCNNLTKKHALKLVHLSLN